MKSNDKRYILIIDTNILFQSYQSYADFTSFSLNSSFQNVIEMINRLDIYDNIEIAIPAVIWNELKKQIVEAHEKRIVEFEKWKFPEYSVKQNKVVNYDIYIDKKISEYKTTLLNGINKIIELPIPTEKCFERIITRAFEKEAPFEGKEKNSDKGFKDVLIWESILELAENNPKSEFIFYSQDKGFKEKLVNEFTGLFPNAEIFICSKKDEVKEQLQSWAKEIDAYSYLPIQEDVEYQKLNEWINSVDLIIQLIDYDFDIVEKSRLIKSTSMHLISYKNIEIHDENENDAIYSFDSKLKILYSFFNGALTEEIINVHIEVEYNIDEIFSIVDAYRINATEYESEG